jgi:hypothetical protein
MSRRKGEVTGHMNEQSFRSQLELLPGGFRSQNLELMPSTVSTEFLFAWPRRA